MTEKLEQLKYDINRDFDFLEKKIDENYKYICVQLDRLNDRINEIEKKERIK